jgi:hypothetical protein
VVEEEMVAEEEMAVGWEEGREYRLESKGSVSSRSGRELGAISENEM